jgi:hypothetical protein
MHRLGVAFPRVLLRSCDLPSRSGARREAIKLTLSRMKLYRGFLLLLVLSGAYGCSVLKVEESTPQAVSIRYDGVIETLEDVTEVARKSCALYGKTVHLQTVDEPSTV